MTDTKTPQCIGVILDGNRRWAKEKGLPTLEGHRKGSEKVREIVGWAREHEIAHVILYAFSTENWNRSPEEIAYLMDLFEETLGRLSEDVEKEDGRIRFIGERGRFSESLQVQMNRAEEQTKNGTAGTLWVALSYGGRAEILSALNNLLKENKKEVTEEDIRSAMWSKDMPDPDLIIRTGGEKRLSNFLTWQSTYSELFFTDTKLPDFSKEEFESILNEYSVRQRRHGK